MHIGNRIREIFNNMPRGCTVVWFAGELCCDRRNIYNIFKAESIDTRMLLRISRVLNHNFFDDLAEDCRQSLDEK